MDRIEQFVSELDDLLKKHGFQMSSSFTQEVDLVDTESSYKLVGYFPGLVEKKGFTKL